MPGIVGFAVLAVTKSPFVSTPAIEKLSDLPGAIVRGCAASRPHTQRISLSAAGFDAFAPWVSAGISGP